MSCSVTIPINLVVNGVPANVPVNVSVSIGQPVFTGGGKVYKPLLPENESKWEPPQRPWNERRCARCDGVYLENRQPWPQLPTCPQCDYNERQATLLPPPPPPTHDWKGEGF